MHQIKHPPMVAPIYAFGITLFVLAVLGITINDGYDVLVMLFVVRFISGITAVICTLRRNARAKSLPPPYVLQFMGQKQEQSSGDSETDAVIKEGRNLLNQLEAVKGKIKNETIISKTNEIIDVSHKILDKLRTKPELHSSVKRFSNYYLPTTTKLITSYSYMESQGVQGGNISNTMEKIENTLDTLKNAYQTQLDSLFSHVAMDLETDIHVLENILKTEGLTQTPFKNSKGEQ